MMRLVTFALIVGLLPAQTASPIRFEILLERLDHTSVVVPAIHEFHSGDRIRLRVRVETPSYLYVVNRTLADFSVEPSALRGNNDALVPPLPDLPHLILGPRYLPSGATELPPMRFDSIAGVEKIYLVRSPKPLDRSDVLKTEAGAEELQFIGITLRHTN